MMSLYADKLNVSHLKETIMGLDQEGYSACKIAEFLSLNWRTVSYIIKRYWERGTVENLPRSDRKKKTNVRTDRLLLRMVKEFCHITSSIPFLIKPHGSFFQVSRQLLPHSLSRVVVPATLSLSTPILQDFCKI
jgi:hypothetical protein